MFTQMTSEALTSYSEDSLAKTSLQVEKGLDWLENALACTFTWNDSLATLDREDLSWRTLQLSLFAEEPELLQVLPHSGMTRHGSLYQLVASEVPKTERVGFFWVTPAASDCTLRQVPARYRVTPTGLVRYVSLISASESQMRLSQHARLVEQQLGCAVSPEWMLNPEWVEMLMGFPQGWTSVNTSSRQAVGQLRRRMSHHGLRRLNRKLRTGLRR